MTKQEILDYFKDIDFYYNNPHMRDSLSRMIDELLEQQPNTIHYSDGCLKLRHKDYVLYNIEWFKENYQQELELLGVEQPEAEE